MVHKYKNTVKYTGNRLFQTIKSFSTNQKQKNVVGKESFYVALSLSVSLSHFSFVSTCVHPGEIECRV
jgi:hypothetical protein